MTSHRNVVSTIYSVLLDVAGEPELMAAPRQKSRSVQLQLLHLRVEAALGRRLRVSAQLERGPHRRTFSFPCKEKAGALRAGRLPKSKTTNTQLD